MRTLLVFVFVLGTLAGSGCEKHIREAANHPPVAGDAGMWTGPGA